MSRTPPLSPPLRPHLSSVATTDPATGSPRRRASTGSSLQDEALERAPTPLLISVQAVSGQDGNGNITDSQYATEDMNGSLPLVVSAGSYLCTGLQQIRFVFSKPGFTLIVLALSSLFFVVTGIQFWATDFLITALDGGKYVGRVRTGWSRLCLSVACLLPVCCLSAHVYAWGTATLTPPYGLLARVPLSTQVITKPLDVPGAMIGVGALNRFNKI